MNFMLNQNDALDKEVRRHNAQILLWRRKDSDEAKGPWK